jgi:CO dehydrogenase maturation factor
MAMTIAVSGKGGVGKTTLMALIIRCLKGKSNQAVLAVDADANACLATALGVEPVGTVADLRDDVLKGTTAPSGGMGKLEKFEYGMHQLITEAQGFDLLTMGRPEGPKCYCAVNNVLRKMLDELSDSYGFVVTDNEAGMEHLSRRTTNHVDWLVIVGEPTKIGFLTVQRIMTLTRELPIDIKNIGVIWNRTDKAVMLDGVNILGCVPHDEAVIEAAIEGKTVFDLDEDSPALSAVREILEQKINTGGNYASSKGD